MKNIYKFMIAGAFLFAGSSLMAQNSASLDCKKTCTVERTVGEGSFLGVQITGCGCKENSEVRVVKVVEGTNAEKMGIQINDRIYAINGTPMTDTKFMVKWVSEKHKDFPVTVSLRRGGKEMKVKGKLGFKEEKVITETICCDENLGQLEVSNFKIYPNPSQGDFTLDFGLDNDQPFQVSIADLAGNIVYENEFANGTRQINQLVNMNASQRITAGEYIIMINQPS